MFKKKSIFIIAEAGINHNGDFKTAKKLILKAKECGADAIKFQSFKAEELIIEEAIKADHVKGKQSFFEMLKSWELADKDYANLAKVARKAGIVFFASVFGPQSLEKMDKIKSPLFKIASCDLNNHLLLEQVAKKKKPVIISIGMGDLKEIKEAVRILGKNQLGILHCVSLYPPEPEELNLQRIAILKTMFPRHTIGYSDHTLDIIAPVAAAALGARIIEKHFTLDKKMSGPDQPSSADPEEFKKMAEQIRHIEKAVNPAKKSIVPGKREKNMRRAFRRSLVAHDFIGRGTKITADHLAVKRPGTGLPSSMIKKVIGKKAAKDIKKNQLIKLADLK